MYCAAEKTMYAIEDCDLKLYQHGESGEPPLDYAFSFKAGIINQMSIYHSILIIILFIIIICFQVVNNM